MFNNSTCPKCKKSLKKDFEFCPYCGTSQNSNNSWGMLGKNDISEVKENPLSQLMPGLTGGILNKMLGNAMKMIERELQKETQLGEEKRINIKPNTTLQFYINGKKIDIGNQINPSGQLNTQKKPVKKQTKKVISKEFTSKINEKFLSLPKEEPETTIRRLSDRIIYEIDIPGVKKVENISIRNLEKSIEIRALSKDKAYYKIILMDLPLVKYSIEKETLILELEAKN